jgi:hypothetical protein
MPWPRRSQGSATSSPLSKLNGFPTSVALAVASIERLSNLESHRITGAPASETNTHGEFRTEPPVLSSHAHRITLN